MGAELVKEVCKTWAKRLSENAFRVLVVMALTAHDYATEDQPACEYYRGHEPLGDALKDSDVKSPEALKKAVQRAVVELLAVGAIEKIGRKGFVGKHKYLLTLDGTPGEFTRDLTRLTEWKQVQDTTRPLPEVPVEDTTRPAGTGHDASPRNGHDVSPTDDEPYGTRRVPQVEDTSCPPATGHVVSPLREEPIEDPNEDPDLFASLTSPEIAAAAPKVVGKRKAKTNADPAADPKFMTWYRAYPNPVKRPLTYQKWLQATKKVDADVLQDLTEAYAKAYAASGKNPDYIPMSTTWLHNECWNDPLPLPRNGLAPVQGMPSDRYNPAPQLDRPEWTAA